MGRLTVLKQIARDLASQFGPDCEIVIHDLKTNDPEHSIVYIENGHVTGRGIGDGPSNAVFDVIRHNNKKEDNKYLAWFKDFANFKKMLIEPILKVTYLILAIFITLYSFGLIGVSFVAFLLTLTLGNILLRLAYETSISPEASEIYTSQEDKSFEISVFPINIPPSARAHSTIVFPSSGS